MRNVLLIIAFIPLIAALAHDAYVYSENQDKGFEFTDIGWIWNKYHAESHLMVNKELKHAKEEAEKNKKPDMLAEPVENAENPGVDDGTAVIKVTKFKDDSPLPDSNEVIAEAAGFAEFLLQQKAVVVGGVFAAIMVLLSFLLGGISFKKKSKDDTDFLSRGKGGAYKYNRK